MMGELDSTGALANFESTEENDVLVVHRIHQCAVDGNRGSILHALRERTSMPFFMCDCFTYEKKGVHGTVVHRRGYVFFSLV